MTVKGGTGHIVEYFGPGASTISSTGNATDFGDLTTSRRGVTGVSNSIRGVFWNGYTAPGKVNVIDYITIGSTGNAADFGDMHVARDNANSAADNHGGLQT